VRVGHRGGRRLSGGSQRSVGQADRNEFDRRLQSVSGRSSAATLFRTILVYRLSSARGAAVRDGGLPDSRIAQGSVCCREDLGRQSICLASSETSISRGARGSAAHGANGQGRWSRWIGGACGEDPTKDELSKAAQLRPSRRRILCGWVTRR